MALLRHNALKDKDFPKMERGQLHAQLHFGGVSCVEVTEIVVLVGNSHCRVSGQARGKRRLSSTIVGFTGRDGVIDRIKKTQEIA
jgi:hypothetical protein